MLEQSQEDQYQQHLKSKHKIELCRVYSQKAVCPYGSSCAFAHGIQQLVMYQPILKANKCKNYFTNGSCRFGERCNFRHDKDARIPKKKNLFRFHRILKEYPDLVMNFMLKKDKSRLFPNN